MGFASSLSHPTPGRWRDSQTRLASSYLIGGAPMAYARAMIASTNLITLACFTIVAAFAASLACLAADSGLTNSAPDKALGRKHQLVEPAEASALIASKKVVVLDVRTPAEFARGHIAGATNLDFHAPDFRSKLEKLDKNQPYLVHCAVGGRSAQACKLMNQLDFKSLYDLKGGMTAWEKAGQPVEK
jgi:phage shock protein E